MPITLQSFIDNGLLDALGSYLPERDQAHKVLNAIGLPRGKWPNFDLQDNPEAFWLKICDLIARGVPPGNFEALLAAAARELPNNTAFAPYRVAPSVNSIPDKAVEFPTGYSGNYDVFLSYSSADLETVRTVKEELTARGILCWMDKQDLLSGERFRPILEKMLVEAKVILVCIGLGGEGPWQGREIDVAVDQDARGKSKLIPLRLPGVPVDAMSPFLRSLNGPSICGMAGPDKAVYDKLETDIRSRRDGPTPRGDQGGSGGGSGGSTSTTAEPAPPLNGAIGDAADRFSKYRAHLSRINKVNASELLHLCDRDRAITNITDHYGRWNRIDAPAFFVLPGVYEQIPTEFVRRLASREMAVIEKSVRKISPDGKDEINHPIVLTHEIAPITPERSKRFDTAMTACVNMEMNAVGDEETAPYQRSVDKGGNISWYLMQAMLPDDGDLGEGSAALREGLHVFCRACMLFMSRHPGSHLIVVFIVKLHSEAGQRNFYQPSRVDSSTIVKLLTKSVRTAQAEVVSGANQIDLRTKFETTATEYASTRSLADRAGTKDQHVFGLEALQDVPRTRFEDWLKKYSDRLGIEKYNCEGITNALFADRNGLALATLRDELIQS